MSRQFEDEWLAVRAHILRLCQRAFSDPRDADEVCQQVAIRAWRGYDSFRGDATFLTWTTSIARREIARAIGGPVKPARAVVSLDVIEENAPATVPAVPAPEIPADERGWAATVTRDAVAEGTLPAEEAEIVLLRLDHPDSTWDQLGASLGVPGATCAVRHFRAIPKLRVFLFTRRPDLCGGFAAIEAAFDRAGRGADPLLTSEAEGFREGVLRRRQDFRPRGWKLHLRAACGKVVHFLDLE